MKSDKQNESKNTINLKNIIAVVATVVILIILAGVFLPKSNTQTVTNPAAGTTETAPAVKLPSEIITISNTSYSDIGYGMGKVVGEAKNNDEHKHTAVLKATFYDAAGKILGTASGVASDVEPGDTKTFELGTTDDVSKYATMKVAVDSLL